MSKKTKTYVITGATSGIGQALVKRLADDNIIFAGYRKEELRNELESISPNIYPFYIDYAKPETIVDAVNFITNTCTKVDTLVNIAGCVVAGPIETIDINEIRRQFDVNVFGHLEFSQLLLELLENGRIINISSMASFGIFPFIAPYCASKKCLDMLFNSLLIESKKNIKVISIKPGVISTPLWNKSIEENSKSIQICQGYEKEMDFMKRNAMRNEKCGISAEKVVDTILKADNSKNPKLSYTVGTDALCAKFACLLPQKIQNNLIKLGMKLRIY